MKDQFDKVKPSETNTVGTPYDYRSVMHYGRTSFRKYNAKGNVMEGKFDPNEVFGNDGLSPIDITELNKLYQCQSKYIYIRISLQQISHTSYLFKL